MKTSILVFIILFITSNLFSQSNSLFYYKPYFDNDLKVWTESFRNFKLKDFKQTDSIKFENIPFDDIKNLKSFYNLYKPALSFSSDSSQFIDIYSYWLNLQKKGNKIVGNVDIDQAVSLCNLKNHKWTRMFFCGFSTRIEETIWINDTIFILAGSFSDDKNLFHPKVLIGDITRKRFFVYTDSLSEINKKGYTSMKFKKLNIQE